MGGHQSTCGAIRSGTRHDLSAKLPCLADRLADDVLLVHRHEACDERLKVEDRLLPADHPLLIQRRVEVREVSRKCLGSV